MLEHSGFNVLNSVSLNNMFYGVSQSCDRQEELQESLMMWVHPSLPFLKVFPRNNSTASDARQKIPHSTALLQDEQVLQALKDDWSELSHHLAPNLLFSPYLTPNFLPSFYLYHSNLSLYLAPNLCHYLTQPFKKLTINFGECSKFVLHYNVRCMCWS